MRPQTTYSSMRVLVHSPIMGKMQDIESGGSVSEGSATGGAGCPVRMGSSGPICGRPIYSAPEGLDDSPVCLMHSKDPGKQTEVLFDEFWLEFEAILKTVGVGEAHFESFVFPRLLLRERKILAICRFENATFTQNAIFLGATFTQNADFSQATFTQTANFRSATFTQNADFSWATFTLIAHFSNTTFTQNADFSQATFTQLAQFTETSFLGTASWRSSRFLDEVAITCGFADQSHFHRVFRSLVGTTPGCYAAQFHSRRLI